MLLYPLPPAQSACILASLSHSCTSDILDILALSSESPIFTDPHSQRDEALAARQPFIHRDGDHLTNLNVLRSYESVPREEGGGMGRKIWCRERFVNERNLKRAIESRDQMREIVERDVARSGIPKLMRGSLVGEPVATEDEEDGVDGDEDEEAKKAKGREAWKKSAGDDSEPILRSLVEGLFAKTAIFNHGEYRQMLGNSVRSAADFVVLLN
jgi:HrpA-like RNA helicase